MLETTGTAIVMLNPCQNSQKRERFTERPLGVLTLVRGTYFQDSVSFPTLTSASVKRYLAYEYKNTASLRTAGCQALGKLSYCSGFRFLVCRMRALQQTVLAAPSSFNIPGFHDPKPWSLLSQQFPDQEHVLSISLCHSQMVSILRALGC